MLKWWELFQKIGFGGRTPYKTYKKYKMTEKLWFKDEALWIKGRSCRAPSSMSNSMGGNAKVLEGDLKKSSSEVWWERKNTSSSSSSESPHSKQASSYILICCCCSLLVLIKVLKYVHANSMSPSPSGNLKTIYSPLLWLRFRFLSFSKHASLPNLKKIWSNVTSWSW